MSAQKENTYKPLVFEDSAFKGKTFWDVLNKQGLSCAVILPMNIKEGWEINGLMITRPYEGKIRVYPQGKESIYNPRVDILGTDGKFTSERICSLCGTSSLQKLMKKSG